MKYRIISANQQLLFVALTVAAVLTSAIRSEAQAQAPPPAAPMNLTASDRAWDGGTTIDLKWTLSPDDRALTKEEKDQGETKTVLYYKVERSPEVDGRFDTIALAEPDKWDYLNGEMMYSVGKCERGEEYFFRLTAVGRETVESETIRTIEPVVPKRQLFDRTRFSLLIIAVMLCGSVVGFIQLARGGRPMKVRKIAGLDAVDEAVGRATEMGRSIMFIPGIQDMNDIQTLAGINILSRVAKTAAQYEAKIEVPTCRSLVMTTARETVHASFLQAGRPDAYNEDLIYYVTDEQFGYVAYLSGMMVREKPAACFYMGSFFAESLILAETGNAIGAIQVAGTAQPAQLPFFVAACDYTLIGEELFAAAAYLSGSPEELGSLKGQDVGKVMVVIGLILGVTVATLAAVTVSDTNTFEWVLEFIHQVVLK